MKPAEPLFLSSTLLMGAYYCNNLIGKVSFRVGSLFAWLRLSQDRATCAQPETLAHTNTPTFTKKY